MKTTFYAFALSVFLVSNAVGAQTPVTQTNEKVTAITKEMSNKLALNESEYIKLKALNLENYAKAKEIKSMYSNDITMRDMKINELQNAYDAQVRAFLNSKQIEAYTSYKENNSNYTAFSEDETK